MGEAKRRGSFEDRVKQRAVETERLRLEELEKKHLKLLEEEARFNALSEEEKEAEQRIIQADRQRTRKLRSYLALALGSIASGRSYIDKN